MSNIRNIAPEYEYAGGYKIPVRRYFAVVVGSGAAGYGCAYSLAKSKLGGDDFCVITEGKNMGTSRNTGSDKQTYYKTADGESAFDMAADMVSGGSMHGDLAAVEAINSLRGFHRLTSIGVPFPHNEYGMYTGYRTDHDTRGRATSCGPLTSKYMTECLEREVGIAGVAVYDGYRAVKILSERGCVAGILTLAKSEITPDNKYGYAVFYAENIVWAVGGPSAVYASTVYPESQSCALGAALMAGAVCENLTEGQYGIASLNPRWNLSGSYQQVLPRYYSVDDNGVCREFLCDYIKSPGGVPEAIFKKGYEWPFTPSRVHGSSAVDIAVFSERLSGKRVFLDFTREPRELLRGGKTDLSAAGDEAAEYLFKCGCKADTPIGRLAEMNMPAIELYRSYGVDLYSEPLEIAVCAQHCNGGIGVNAWYESSVRGLFAIGEAAGVFGVTRPGGSALNSTQVGGIRATEMIEYRYSQYKSGIVTERAKNMGNCSFDIGRGSVNIKLDDILHSRAGYAAAMTDSCSFIRSEKKIKSLIGRVSGELSAFKHYGVNTYEELRELYINYDILITQLAMLSASYAYIADGGGSRGSYLITDSMTDAGAEAITSPDFKVIADKTHHDKVITTRISADESGINAVCGFIPSRPLPDAGVRGKYWFENVYRDYLCGAVYEKLL